MIQLHQTLKEISAKFNYKLEEIQPTGTYKMDVAIPLKDGKWRYQNVYIWIVPGRYFGKDTVYMNSRAGIYRPDLNLYGILKEARPCCYCSITITSDKLGDGTPVESIIAQSALVLETTTAAEVSNAIYDVAVAADYIEEKFFGGDVH